MKSTRIEKIRRIVTICSVMIIFFTVSAYAANEFHISNDFAYTYNDVSGPGAENSSSLTRGWRYLNTFGFTGSGTLRGNVDYNFNLGVKTTDDPRNDVTTWSLTNFQGRMSNKIHTVTGGDTFESFSQYSLSTALKGASYKYFNEAKNSPELTFVYGFGYPRWDNIWGGRETRAIEREAYGFRIKQNITQGLWLAGSFAGAKDKAGTRLYDTDPVEDDNTVTFDGEYIPIPGLTLRSELSFSKRTMSPSEDTPDETSHGTAFKLEAVGDGGPSRVSLEYERVSSKYFTILGSASPDREKIKGKWRYKWTKNTDLNLGMLWFRDDLDGRKTYRSDSFTPDASISIRNILGRTTASIDFGYRFDRRYGGSVTEGGSSQADHIATLNYRDRFWDMVESDANFGYSLYSTEPDQNDRNEYTYNLSLNSRHTLNDDTYVLKPTLYLGGSTFRDDLAYASDQIYEYSMGLGFEAPKLKVTCDAKIGQNRLEKGVPGTGTKGDNSTKTFGSFNLNYRPPFLAKLNTGMLYLRAYVNDFRYSTIDNNFRETSITMGINMEF